MHIEFNPGFSVYRSDHVDPVYVTPHSGSALETPTSRDDNSETVASLCWMKTGGSLIVSNIPRKRALGVDFNRDIPPKEESMRKFSDFLADRNQKDLYDFRKKYAFSAINSGDYSHRLKIYNDFWREVKRGAFIVLVHTAFSRLKAIPSIMDIATFDNLGINRDFLANVVNEVNRDHADFLKRIEKSYKSVVFLEEERTLKNLVRVYKRLGIEKIDFEFLENLENDFNVIKKYLGEDSIDELVRNFTMTAFMNAVKKTLREAGTPKVTVEQIFKAKKSAGPKKQLFPSSRIVIQVEPTSFLSFWHPHKASEIITEIVYKITDKLSH